MSAADPLVKVSVYMPASLAQQLDQHARDTKSSVSEFCRSAARAAMQDQTQQAKP
jgi:metal-responsive CopG/Arc/MetJ family transcriptional regulator